MLCHRLVAFTSIAIRVGAKPLWCSRKAYPFYTLAGIAFALERVTFYVLHERAGYVKGSRLSWVSALQEAALESRLYPLSTRDNKLTAEIGERHLPIRPPDAFCNWTVWDISHSRLQCPDKADSCMLWYRCHRSRDADPHCCFLWLPSIERS
jgi:hypothetical protein